MRKPPHTHKPDGAGLTGFVPVDRSTHRRTEFCERGSSRVVALDHSGNRKQVASWT